METAELEKWIIEKSVFERTMAGFWKNFENYKIDEPQEFSEIFAQVDKDDLVLNVNRISLNLTNWSASIKNTISSNISIVYGNKDLGYYELIFDMAGNIVDDYFVIY